jgi:hypothetical protein
MCSTVDGSMYVRLMLIRMRYRKQAESLLYRSGRMRLKVISAPGQDCFGIAKWNPVIIARQGQVKSANGSHGGDFGWKTTGFVMMRWIL